MKAFNSFSFTPAPEDFCHLFFVIFVLLQELKERSDWRERWHGQLAELQRRSMNDYKDNLSWGALMRRRRAEFSKEVP